jgi:hypothetical protein
MRQSLPSGWWSCISDNTDLPPLLPLESVMFYAILADALAAFHFAYVAFVVVGELASLI